ncbi:MAG: sugar ABC transporter ATP-binding protein [Planctomycetes bacterium]|nr:sugar ABC transporter ATP-binding protein [Planctomycetota bacterium]
MNGPALLNLRGVARSFGAVQALKPLDLEVHAGEVHAIVGENGAGKSTLLKLVAGVLRPDAGVISIHGQTQRFSGPKAARRAGIALLPQEVEVPENMTAADCIALGREKRGGWWRQRRAEVAEAQRVLALVHAQFAADTPVEQLSIGARQQLLLARALAEDAKLLVLDEPTSALSAREAEQLMLLVESLRARGAGILFISHRLPEVLRLADRVTVLRDGERVAEFARATCSAAGLVAAMVGRNLPAPQTRALAQHDTLLQVRGLRTAAHAAHSVDFDMKRGEIVALSGLVGSGRTEILRSVFGADMSRAGNVAINGVTIVPGSPLHSTRAGFAFVPEDRRADGIFDGFSVENNLGMSSVQSSAGAWWRSPARERQNAQRVAADAGIAATRLAVAAETLSGGNQQKVMLARWLTKSPTLLLLDEPTRGIDVAARAEIHALLLRLAAAGTSVLFASSEMEEVLHLADRVLVLHEGRLAGTLERADLNEERLLALATGAHAA